MGASNTSQPDEEKTTTRQSAKLASLGTHVGQCAPASCPVGLQLSDAQPQPALQQQALHEALVTAWGLVARKHAHLRVLLTLPWQPPLLSPLQAHDTAQCGTARGT